MEGEGAGKFSHMSQTRVREIRFGNCSPICPYMHMLCLNYNSVKKQAVCQGKGNQHQKGARCSWVPSFVSNGYHVAVLRGGFLRVC